MPKVIEVPDYIDPNQHQGFSICGISFNKKGELIAEYYRHSYSGYSAWRDYKYLNAMTGEISDYKFGVKRFAKKPSHECGCGLSIDRCQH